MGPSGHWLWNIDSNGLGHVYIENGSINVDVTVADYISVVGSPNYNLPVNVAQWNAGSVQTWSAGASSNTYVASGDNMKVWVASGANLLGSFFQSNWTGSAHVTNLPVTQQIIGSPNYNLPTVGSFTLEGQPFANFAAGSINLTYSGTTLTVASETNGTRTRVGSLVYSGTTLTNVYYSVS